MLVDESTSALAVYRLQSPTLVEIFRDESESKILERRRGGPGEADTQLPQLVAVRSADPPLPALVIWQWDPVRQQFVDFDPDVNEAFDPAPRYVFLAETVAAPKPDGASKPYNQVFLLRDIPLANQTSPQLIGRNFGSFPAVAFEVRLATDNAFRSGVGGDFDGNGLDSIAVLSRKAIRIFDFPATSTAAWPDVAVDSNGRTIVAGNLDAKGSAQPDSLVVAPSHTDRRSISAAGTQDPVLRTFPHER